MRNATKTLRTALCVAAAFAALGAGKPEESKTGVSITVKPLDTKYYKENRIVVEFTYRVTRPREPGVAEVALHNVDTGGNFVKEIPVEYSLGEHAGWAAWGGNAPWTSSKESEFDLLLDGDDVLDEGVPDGFYIPQVVLKDGAGAVLAEQKYSSDEISHMRATGKTARKINKEAIEKKGAQIKAWFDELSALEKKAADAGADTSLPRLMLTALKETLRQQPDRLNALEYDVVSDNFDFCAKQVPKTRQQFEALIRDPKSGVSVDIFPRPKERMSSKDGYFYAGDKPVFMMGMCMFALWPDIDLMRKMNFNLVHIEEEIDAFFTNPESGAADGELLVSNGSPPYKIRDFLDKCSKLGIKADLGLSARPPKWFFKKYPEARLRGHSIAGFIPWDVEHPDTRAWTEKYFDEIMKEVANHPALNSIWLANEPSMLNLGPLSESLFQDEMRQKYADIAALNAAWGSAYESFGDIKLALDTKAMGEGATEFWWFNLGRLTKFFEFMQQCVRKHDATVNTCYKLSNLQMGWHCPPMNVDQEGVTDIGEITGMDSGTLSFAKPYYDWLRSLSPEKPVVNLEFKGGGGHSWLTFWRAAFFGLAGIDWWCWHQDSSFSSAMCYTAALHDGPAAMFHIQRNIDVVMDFQKFPRSPFVVVYPDPVLPRARSYFEVHTPTVHALRTMGYTVDYATEKRIAKGRLDEYKYDIIVLPAANFIKDETLERVGKFVENGGKAIVLGTLPGQNPMGVKRENLGWLTIPAGAKQGIDICAESKTFTHGKGKIWTLPAGKEKEIKTWLEAIAAETLPPLPVVIDDFFETRTIARKTDKGEDGFVTYILPYHLKRWPVEGDLKINATFNHKVKEAVDLITGEKLDPANLTIPPYGVRLIQWTPAK